MIGKGNSPANKNGKCLKNREQMQKDGKGVYQENCFKK